jgi:sugar lactone lactonase YvrE/tetratricopeptide (TPR) repeat protein
MPTTDHRWSIAAVLVVVFWLALGSPFPASADGPIIPTYIMDGDGQRVPSPAGYIHVGVISCDEQATGALSSPQDLFLYPENGHLFIADTGNNRIVELDDAGQFVREVGKPDDGLSAPEGAFIDPSDRVWVADTGNKRIVAFDGDGQFLAEYHAPDSSFLEGIVFDPKKIVLDRRGYIYTVIGGEKNQGIVVMDVTEHFRGFFGRTRMKFDLKRVLARLLASEAQRRRMVRAQPAPLDNIHLDAQGFIYATSTVLKRDQIQRLNSVGENVYGDMGTRIGAGDLWDKIRGKEGQRFGEAETRWKWDSDWDMMVSYEVGSIFSDVAVDELGIISVLDQQQYLIYQYDQAGNLLTIFGGQGPKEGAFAHPVSLVAGKDGWLYVLDAGRGNIQVFRPTDLMRQIHQASHEYYDGKYERAAAIWSDIAQRNTNFALAHTGLGKALMSQERFAEAMQEYRYAENQSGYSEAFREYRYLWMRERFGAVGTAAIAFLIVTNIAAVPLRRGGSRLLAWLRDVHLRSGLKAAPVLLALAVVARMVSLSVLSFHFRTQRPEETKTLFEIGKILIPWITWCVSALAVSEILYGEGSFRQIVIDSAWSLWPFILLAVPVNLVTRVLTLDEKALFRAGWLLIWGLVFWQFFRQGQKLHNLETGKSILLLALSLLGMFFVWTLLGLIYALTGEIVRFVREILLEIYIRRF